MILSARRQKSMTLTENSDGEKRADLGRIVRKALPQRSNLS